MRSLYILLIVLMSLLPSAVFAAERISIQDARPDLSFSVLPPSQTPPTNWRASKDPHFPPVEFRPLDSEGKEENPTIVLYVTTLSKNVFGQTNRNFDIDEYIRQDTESLKKDLPGGSSAQFKIAPEDIKTLSGARAKVMMIVQSQIPQVTFRSYITDKEHDAVGMVMLIMSGPMKPSGKLTPKEMVAAYTRDFEKVIGSFAFEGAIEK